MAIVHGTLARPLEDVAIATRQVAARQGYLLSEGESVLGVLMFRKGVTFLSWGSQLKVSLDAISSTSLTITTGETFAITDWGRGKRAANRLPAALGQSSTRRTGQLLGISRQRVQQNTPSDPASRSQPPSLARGRVWSHEAIEEWARARRAPPCR